MAGAVHPVVHHDLRGSLTHGNVFAGIGIVNAQVPQNGKAFRTVGAGVAVSLGITETP